MVGVPGYAKGSLRCFPPTRVPNDTPVVKNLSAARVGLTAGSLGDSAIINPGVPGFLWEGIEVLVDGAGRLAVPTLNKIAGQGRVQVAFRRNTQVLFLVSPPFRRIRSSYAAHVPVWTIISVELATGWASAYVITMPGNAA